MKFILPICAAVALFAITNCTVYRSPDRKDFESENSTFRTQNLVKTDCSSQSVRHAATQSRLVTVLKDDTTNESEFLWEYKIQNESTFESDNLKGAYCVYESN